MTYIYQMISRAEALEKAKRLEIDNIWKLANVEIPRGVTFPETVEIYEGRVPKDADVKKVVVVNNIKHAWQFLFENIDYALDYQLVAEYNRIVGTGLEKDPGKLRQELVTISGTEFIPDMPTFKGVKSQIEMLSGLENPVNQALEVFAKIARGQWFANGNKRTAYMLANHLLLQHNVGLFAIPVEENENFVNQLIAYYESAESELLKDFLYESSVRLFPEALTQQQRRKLTEKQSMARSESDLRSETEALKQSEF
ncbi:MAG: Fic family protein [Streptococcaceae bacterium]|jgi:prophage maintenance system killer protein|nr:Fic family protein [Streptococcaceae bacterium]